MTPTDEQIAILRHTTGDNGGARNYYCTADGDTVCEALVVAGLMERGGTINDGRDRYYGATPKGIQHVEAAIRREMEASGKRWWTCGGVFAGNPWSKVVKAKTRGQARYFAALDMMDFVDFMSAVRLVEYVRVSP